MKPSAKLKKFPKINEIPLAPELIRMQIAGKIQPLLKTYQMGKLSIFVGYQKSTGWHVSISHPSRYPHWDEIVHIRYELLPDNLTMGILLPPMAEYINIHPNCFQLHQIGEGS